MCVLEGGGVCTVGWHVRLYTCICVIICALCEFSLDIPCLVDNVNGNINDENKKII